MFFSNLFSDPAGFIKTLLIMLPGMLLALSLHESAHGYIAHLCGDDTAKLSGRITLNPAKHFDPMGFLCMLIIGFGWAKPVPVNPNNFRSYRRDDIKVALAGITANLLLFLLCFAIMMGIFCAAVGTLPDERQAPVNIKETKYFTFENNGETCLWMDGVYVDSENAFRMAAGVLNYSYGTFYSGKKPDLIDGFLTPVLGSTAAIIYQMIMYCAIINLSLAVFNLIPLPPLDGYHVLNDLVLKQDLFAQMRTARISSGILMALIIIGNYKPEWDVIAIVIGAVRTFFFGSFSTLFRTLAGLLGIF